MHNLVNVAMKKSNILPASQSMAWLLMPWLREEPVHQEAQCWQFTKQITISMWKTWSNNNQWHHAIKSNYMETFDTNNFEVKNIKALQNWINAFVSIHKQNNTSNYQTNHSKCCTGNGNLLKFSFTKYKMYGNISHTFQHKINHNRASSILCKSSKVLHHLFHFYSNMP